MSTFKISATPCTYQDGCVSILLSVMARNDLYSKTFEATSVADVEREIREARAALAGQDVYLYVGIKAGRKPNGFDRWYANNRAQLYVQKNAAPSVAELAATRQDASEALATAGAS